MFKVCDTTENTSNRNLKRVFPLTEAHGIIIQQAPHANPSVFIAPPLLSIITVGMGRNLNPGFQHQLRYRPLTPLILGNAKTCTYLQCLTLLLFMCVEIYLFVRIICLLKFAVCCIHFCGKLSFLAN